MSSKTVKVTNGKILNYTIKADGYKTINGSQLITADTTISKTMIPTTDPNGVYTLGDRLGGIASFVCYFNATNPDTQADEKYAVFVLDAKYRTTNVALLTSAGTYLTQQYSTTDLALAAKESAIYNTNFLINNNTEAQAPAVYAARNAATITVDGVVYQAQVPNLYELNEILSNYSALDLADTTTTDYSSLTLTTMFASTVWSSSARNTVRGYIVSNFSLSQNTYASGRGVVPVFEIPVE